MIKRTTVRKRIQKGLIEQLKAKGADTPFFLDMVEKYMDLWDDVEEMRRDLKERGRHYPAVSSVGKAYEKENENIKLVPQYLKEMRSILSDMKISADNIVKLGDDDDEL